MSQINSEEVPHTPIRPIMTKDGLKIPPTPFLNCLGLGTGVNVWELANPGVKSPWAVKNVRKAAAESVQKTYQNLINREARVLADIEHENIIGYRGLLQSVDGRQCLAMESCGTSLGDLIEQRSDHGLPRFGPSEISEVVFSIAKALNYLHKEKNLLHGDIKSYNILIKENFDTVKLCDFGACVQMDENGVAEYYTGTTIYNAPEVVREDSSPITAKCEIFSLGLVIWEMIALRPPHTDQFDSVSSYNDSLASAAVLNESEISVAALNGSEVSNVSDLNSSIIQLTDVGTRPALPEDLGPEYKEIVDLFFSCTRAEPADRPSAADIVDAFQKNKENNA